MKTKARSFQFYGTDSKSLWLVRGSVVCRLVPHTIVIEMRSMISLKTGSDSGMDLYVPFWSKKKIMITSFDYSFFDISGPLTLFEHDRENVRLVYPFFPFFLSTIQSVFVSVKLCTEHTSVIESDSPEWTAKKVILPSYPAFTPLKHTLWQNYLYFYWITSM